MSPSHPLSPYTDDPSAPPSVIFPNHTTQILSIILNLVGISIVTWALARRTITYKFRAPLRWKDVNWARLCVVLVFVNSWAFIFTAGVLISGAGLSLNSLTCLLGIYACIVLYAASKILTYAFLIERVYLVWCDHAGGPPHTLQTRWNSLVWRICMLALVPYLGILVLMFVGRIGEVQKSSGVCIIGLQKFASLPLLVFDLCITFTLTALFVHPLRESSTCSVELRRLAFRTLCSSAVALTTSAVNIAVLTILHGRELGWVCLTSCGADVTINGIVLFWVTKGRLKPSPHVDGLSIRVNYPTHQHRSKSDWDDDDWQEREAWWEASAESLSTPHHRTYASSIGATATKSYTTLVPPLPLPPPVMSPRSRRMFYHDSPSSCERSFEMSPSRLEVQITVTTEQTVAHTRPPDNLLSG